MTSTNSETKPKADSLARHKWIEDARVFCTKRLAKQSHTVPENTRITIGFPSTGGRGMRIGECWDPVACSDGHVEIFISPKLSDSVMIVGTLLHELVHAAVGVEAKHGPVFKAAAEGVGLTGKMRATTCGEALTADIEAWVAKRGPYPAGALSLESRKKQTTRLLKAECETCGYVCRVTKKWVDEVGAPHCPDHGAMTVEGMSDEDPTEDMPDRDDTSSDDDLSDILDEPTSDEDSGDLDAFYRVRQDELDRSECFRPEDRAAAEAKARQWSKTGKERMAVVWAVRDETTVGTKPFTGGLAIPASGEYPLEDQ